MTISQTFPFVSTDYKKLLCATTRCQSAKETLRKVWPRLNHLGISRISDITDLDHIGIPVISATRPGVNDEQITATQGKGAKKIDAIVSALMEAVERYSAANFSRFTVASEKVLSEKRLNYLASLPQGLNHHENDVFEWVVATHLTSGNSCFIPAAEVVFPYNPPEGISRPVRPSTTGLTSGNTPAEALLHGIFEVVERDTISKFLYGAGVGLVDLNTVNSPIEKKLIQKLQQGGLDILVLDMSNLAPLPTYYVSLLNTIGMGPDIACAGQGTHLCPEIALRRALTEAAQSRVVAIQGSREDLARHASDWQGSYKKFQLMRAEMKQSAMNSVGMVPMPSSTYATTPFSINDYLLIAQEKLTERGYQHIFYTDLTHQKIEIPVIHVMIPGMVDNIVEPSRRRASLQELATLDV